MPSTPTCSQWSRSRPGTASGTCAPSTPRASRSARRRTTRARSSSRARAGACSAAPARDNGRARQALESVHKHLYTNNGIVLHQPAFTGYHLELGEVTSYPPGYKENAGIFSHNNTWIHLGWCLLGDGDRALEYYLSICPSAQADIETYRAEPYVYAQMIAGSDAATPGEAKNSWLTGTAAWTFVTVSQGILGIKPDYDGLRIDPCIPPGWSSYSVTRRFRGVTYEISVSNPDGVSTGVRSLTVDGREVDGNVVPLAEGSDRVVVEVVLGGDRRLGETAPLPPTPDDEHTPSRNLDNHAVAVGWERHHVSRDRHPVDHERHGVALADPRHRDVVATPRKRRVALKPGHSAGSAGAIWSPR